MTVPSAQPCRRSPVPVVPAHGPVPCPCHPGEGLVPGADGSQCQGSQLRMAGPLPALLPPASTQHPVVVAPMGVPGWAAPLWGCRGTQPCPWVLARGLWVPTMGYGHPAPLFPPQGLQDCVADLLQPFQGDTIDMVAGIDAMGFILGSAAAAVLQKGFLAIRKAGHLCVQTVAQPYTDYSGREKVMEVRTDAISPGVAAICIEDSEGGRWIQEHYKCSHCVPLRLQPRFDHHQFGWD
uniref:adenine phosphoribosyltransferase n=1 Tax=Strigops habroptila TaxID=2489341 RepID=A0A672TWM1_STRHB